ncbi:hypothetical protein ACHQM5_025894 [Ranunculus cassubicifolius]
MSSSRPNQVSSSSNRSKHSARVIAQTTVDAKLHAEFEESGGGSSFDYSRSVTNTVSNSSNQQPRSNKVTTAYLHHIQKGKFIQPFGCLLALDEKTCKVIAYSENAPEMLTMVTHAVPTVGEHPVLGIGTDLRAIFTTPSASALHKALGYADVSLLNPILVHCKTSGKPFYAIVHRVTGSVIIDFEPVKPYEVPMTAAGALQSYKLAAKAIAKLQSLPGGSIDKLCDTVVQEVFELTGYDRVMAYKFHDDDHGEVVSETTKEGLEPYLGLHYPATDIPQAARFLFMKNKIRMICDCRAKHVRVLQDEKLSVDLTLCGSSLRAPHSCHLQYMENMDSIASLVMAVIVNDGDVADESTGPSQSQKRKRLWGLVVCHNTTPRFVPFPLRYACEFLIQVFAIHVNKEFELERQVLEKNILRTQTLLCDMLMRNVPLGIISQNPNIMDLVRCDGAALLFKNKIWRLGVSPSEHHIRDIASWVSEYHMDSTGLSTDSLYDAGFPGALSVGDSVCGMAAVRINTNDMLFWFRSHTAAEIRWGGAKHDPGEKDDGRKMHPRSSFKAFLEVVKTRSVSWKDYEMDAIHSLQLILRNAFKEEAETADGNNNVIHSQLNNLKIDGVEELEAVTNEMVRLIETATVPILAVDINGLINGWNSKIAQLTGLSVDQAIGKHFLKLVEDSSADTVKKMLHLALLGREEQNVHFEMKTHGALRDSGPVSLIVNACASRDLQENVVGVCFVAQDITSQKMVMDKFTRIQGDYKAILQNPSPLIPPIFGTDEFGWCCEWNPAMTKLCGWDRGEVIDKMLLGEIFGTQTGCCRLKNQETFVNLGILLNGAMMGEETDKISFGFYGRNGKYVDCLLSVSKKIDAEGTVTGVFCFLHIVSQELQQALHVQRLSEQSSEKKSKELAYMKRQIRNPLAGIIFSRKMMEETDLDGEQRQLLHTSMHCQRQLHKVLDDTNLESIMDGYVDLEMVEFTLQEVVFTSISQVKIKSDGKSVRISFDSLEDTMTETLYGDSLRLQQVLADFMLASVNFTPKGGQLGISATLTRDRLGQKVHLARLEIRLTHSGSGIPEELLSQMFESDGDTSEEGVSLLVCRKLLRLMNGDVQYLREAGKSSFIITVELASAPPKSQGRSISGSS